MSNITNLPLSYEPADGYKNCPFCAEEIRIDAIKCKHCQSFLIDIDEDVLFKKREEVLQDGHPSLGDKEQLKKHLEKFSDRIKTIKHKNEMGRGLQKRVVVILFADIGNYTGLTEKLDIEVLKSILDDCYNGFYKTIVKYEGVVDKFIGDAVMALFGVPSSHEDDPVRAVKAAMEMIELTTSIGKKHGVNLSLSAGINMGSVLFGGIGGDLELDYTALGDPVNLACRLEQNAPENTVLVSEGVYNGSYTHFKYEEKAPIRVKGKTELIPIYRVLEEGRGSLAGTIEDRIPFVGRLKELKTLNKTISSMVNDKKPRFILIEGEVGVGKTRVLQEIQRYYEGNIPVYMTHGVSYFINIPYYPLLIFLRKITGVLEKDSKEEIELKCRSLAHRYNLQSLNGKIFSYYLGASLKDVHELTPRQRKEDFFKSVYTLLKALSGGDELIFIFDDVHWYDFNTLSLIEYLFEMALRDKVPFLFLGAYRPRFHYKWRIKVDRIIRLKELSLDDSYTLVNRLLKIDTMPANLLDDLYTRSKGNPFYIKEILLHLVEKKILAWNDDDERYVILKENYIKDLDIPVTVQGVVQSRIDVLSQDLREILLCASVIGTEFRYKLLRNLYTYERDLKQKLSTLMDFEMIFEKSSIPELEYLFKHAVTREVAYNSMLKKQKKDYHHRIGLAIESLYADKLDEYYELLAFHFTRSHDFVKSLYYLEKAGKKSEMLYANQAALDYYGEVCEILEEKGDEKTFEDQKKYFDFLIRRVNILNLSGEYSNSLDLLKESEKKVQKLGDIRILARYHYASALVYYYTSQFTKARQYLKKAQDLYFVIQDEDGDRKCNNLLGSVYLKTAQYKKALKCFQAYLRQAMKEGDLNAVANVRNNQGLCYWYCADYENALKEYCVSLEIRKELPNKRDLVATYNNIGIIYERMKQYKESMKYYREGLNIAIKIGYTSGIIALYVNLGQLHYYIEQLNEAEEYYKKAAELCLKIGDKAYYALTLGNQALIEISRQNYFEAGEYLKKALQLAEKENYYEAMANAYIHSIRLHGQQGKKKEAKEWYEKALALIQRKNMQDCMFPLKEVKRFVG